MNEDSASIKINKPLEAAAMLDPRIGKEQARKYAKSLNCRFAILSNGKLHYFWDLERGEPYLIISSIDALHQSFLDEYKPKDD